MAPMTGIGTTDERDEILRSVAGRTVLDALTRTAEQHAGRPAYSDQVSTGSSEVRPEWRTLTWAEVRDTEEIFLVGPTKIGRMIPASAASRSAAKLPMRDVICRRLAPIKIVGDAEGDGECERRIGCSAIPDVAVGPSALDQEIRVPQQPLHRGWRSKPVGARFQDEQAFLVCHGGQGYRQPVAFSEPFCRVASVRCSDPGLVRLDD